MAEIKPFQAWRPIPEKASEVASVPYDVISTEEARENARGNPYSFLHVIRPEIDLPEDTPYNDPAVYEQGDENLQHLLQSDLYHQEPEPALYLYRLTDGDHTQTGLFTCVSVSDYDNEVILKHELTRPAKEDDRTRHILTQSAHAEPVMMTFKDHESITERMDRYCESHEPLYRLEDERGVDHRIWKVPDTSALEDRFKQVEHLYIADGHHRCKSASRAAEERRRQDRNPSGEEEFNYFPAVLFPMSQMRILAYNRLIHTVPDDFIEQLSGRFDLTENADPTPGNKGELSLYHNGQWYGLTLPLPDHPSSVEKLDVYRLQHFLLEPLLGISDPRTDDNISFVGGIRGTGELERLVENGRGKLGISMYPTDIRELVDVSDEGLLMPPKSTWFEPKLKSGLLIHTF